LSSIVEIINRSSSAKMVLCSLLTHIRYNYKPSPLAGYKTENASLLTPNNQGIDSVPTVIEATNIIRNGQILIQKGNKRYTTSGQEVK